MIVDKGIEGEVRYNLLDSVKRQVYVIAKNATSEVSVIS